ncbi:MAG: hypothetical protein WD336_12350 [Trueperaceae bacterium]
MTHLLQGTFVALVLLTESACTVTLGPDVRTGIVVEERSSDRDDRVLNPYLGLTAYPGSVVLRQEVDGRDSETAFRSSAGLRELYRHVHEQMRADGWSRTDLDVDGDEIEAEYRRGGVEIELKLEREGGDRYVLEIDVD